MLLVEQLVASLALEVYAASRDVALRYSESLALAPSLCLPTHVPLAFRRPEWLPFRGLYSAIALQ